MSKKDRELALMIHNAQMAAERAARQEKNAIEKERIAVEREAVAAQREATKAQDRVSITVEEYLGMRAKIERLEKEMDEAFDLIRKIRLYPELIKSINADSVKTKIIYTPETFEYNVGIFFKANPKDEISLSILEDMRKGGA